MNPFDKFEETRKTLADRLLLVGAIVSIPAAVASGYRISMFGVKALFVLDILIAIILVVTYVFRRYTNYRKRMALLLAYVFILGWVSLNTLGLFGFGLFIMFFSILLTTLFFGLRYGLYLLGFTIVITVLVGLSVQMKWLVYSWDFNALSHSPYQWYSRVIFFGAFATLAVVSQGLVNSNLERINYELSKSEERLSIALDSVNEVVWDIDLHKRDVFISQKFFELLHYGPNDLEVKIETWRNLIHPDDLTQVYDDIEKHLKGETPKLQVEYRLKNSTGNYQWVLSKGKVIEWLPNGKPLRFVGTHADITVRKEMEHTLRESEHRYRMLYMTANDAILLIENEIIVDTNESAYGFFGMVREQLIGMNLWNLCPSIQTNGTRTTEGLRNLFQLVSPTNPLKVEWEFERLDGQIVDANMSVNSITDEGRTLYQVILHDISESKRFEQAKLNAIVESEERLRLKLSGDLHDEIGPLLSSLNMYLSLLKRPQNDGGKHIVENMESIIVDTIRSVREISSDLSPHSLEKFGLVKAIDNFCVPFREKLNIEIHENLIDERLPRLVEVSCFRILKELFNNTIKYAQAQRVVVKIDRGENFVSVSYFDDGVGFDLGETMNEGKGGIGLLNILSRINALKANYEMNSQPGEGFKFEMKFRVYS